MGVENRGDLPAKKTNSARNKSAVKGRENAEADQRKPAKRKFSIAGEGNSKQSLKQEDKEPSCEVNIEKDDDLLAVIANENDSSDEDVGDKDDNAESESGSEDEPIFESVVDSDDLSFEDDSEDEENSEDEVEGKENGAIASTSSNTKDFGNFTRTFKKATSISEVKKVSKNKVKRETNAKNVKKKKPVHKKNRDKKGPPKKDPSTPGQFVKPHPEKVLCGQTEDEESQEEEEKEEIEDIVDQGKTGLKTVPKRITLNRVADDYGSDTSDEEDIRNTVGNIPMNWYDDYKHLGYDWEGKQILKPPRGDELDNFLKKTEDPNFWRTVKDPQTGQDVILCDADAELIGRIQNHHIPDSDFNEYAPWIEWFSSDVLKTPLRKFPEHKRSFVPSKDEARQVGRIVHAIKMGWIKPRVEKSKEPQFYMLWDTDDTAEHMRRVHQPISAPKRHLPMHAESYNPPPEYLFDRQELRQWQKLKESPWKRKVHFIPQKYSSLRDVPSYDRYCKERFLRCLDLYLCPRARKMRLLIQPEDLVPQLPSPKDLQPFPTTLALVYKGHTDMVRCITVEPKGQYLASGSDDLTVKLWEVATGRCIRTIPAGGVVRSVSWCPNVALSLLAIAADRKLLLINPEVGDLLVVKKTDTLLEEPPKQDDLVTEKVKSAVQWEQIVATGVEWKKGIRISINHLKEIKQVTWHGRGDYFATVMSDANNRSVVIHQVSKRKSQIPFSRSKGLVQCVLFHPIQPLFFVATQKNVRVYDLVKQEIVKKLLSNAKWISTMAVHPGGDNLLVGTYDRKILWFDLDLSTKPYQTLRIHSYAVRGIAFHKRYPLFASGSDDNSVIVCHGMIYNDLLQNPLIVPLKRMSYHEVENDFSVFEVQFHPSQPWLFSSGADGTVRLYT